MSRNFISKAKSWAAKNKLLGPQAFQKYVLFNFIEALNEISSEFIFKGGNLLWIYISTPRATVDLDLATLNLEEHEEARKILNSVKRHEGISFELEKFEKTDSGRKHGALIVISYVTDTGATNKFSIDLVYCAPVDFEGIASPINEKIEIQVASIENIIADKLNAIQRFKAGNTRVKDFDDLWRITKNKKRVNKKKLFKLIETRKIDPPYLLETWINAPMERAWSSHGKKYKDLPTSLKELFVEVNEWLEK